MIQDYHGFHEKKEEFVAACYHEAGHIAIARFFDPEIHITSRVYKSGYGEADIKFPEDTSVELKYLVGVAGCIGEAISGRIYEIDIEHSQLELMANSILQGMTIIDQNKSRIPEEELLPEDIAFKFEALINPGSQTKQTTTNDDDFHWRTEQSLDRPNIVLALRTVGNLFNSNDDVKKDYKAIAQTLLKNKKYDSKTD